MGRSMPEVSLCRPERFYRGRLVETRDRMLDRGVGCGLANLRPAFTPRDTVNSVTFALFFFLEN